MKGQSLPRSMQAAMASTYRYAHAFHLSRQSRNNRGKMRRRCAVKGSAASPDDELPSSDGSSSKQDAESSSNGLEFSDYMNYDPLKGIEESLKPLISSLPSSAPGMFALQKNAEGFKKWHANLRRGLLPSSELEWPTDPEFRSQLHQALKDLDMPRFCRKYPQLMQALERNILEVLYKYEVQASQLQEEEEEEEDPMPDSPRNEGQRSGGQEAEDGQDNSQGTSEGDESEGQGEGDAQGEGQSQQQGEPQEGEDYDFSMQAEKEGDEQEGADAQQRRELAKEMVDSMKDQWQPITEQLEEANKLLEGVDLEDLTDGTEGYSLEKGMWQSHGWQELEELRKRLQNMKDLRDLIRSLGRGSGRGPMRRAPRQRWRQGFPPGVIRSESEPRETRGLTRSGDLSRMLPSEYSLFASQRRGPQLLHKARHIERLLFSYERSGWVDEQAVTTEGTEIRPASQNGPLIVCVDTSGSMQGTREKVAKAVAVESLRQARTQERPCLLYSFSGPGQCEELELKSLPPLLDFISHSFRGGTDVEQPLERALERMGQEVWENADILLVTDGEVPPPNEEVMNRLNAAKRDLAVRVYALVIGDKGNTDVLDKLCTDIHRFAAMKR